MTDESPDLAPDTRDSNSRAGTRRRRWLTVGLKFAAASLFTIVLLEIALRIVGMGPGASGEQRNEADLHSEPFIAEAQREGWIPWPSTVTRVDDIAEHPRGYIELVRNGSSFREDTETPLEKPADTYRILVTGDSHTDGVVFNNESYANLLEQQLNKGNPNRSFDVINAGFGRTSPYQQLWAYQKVLRNFDPDFVVVGYYAGNDLLELMRKDDRIHLERQGDTFVHQSPQGDQAPAAGVSGWDRLKRTLRDYSAIYHALARFGTLRRAVHQVAGDDYRSRLEAAHARKTAAVWQGLNQAYYFQHHPDEWEDALEQLRFILSEFRRLTDEDRVGLVIVIIPTLRQVDPAHDAEAFDDVIAMLELNDADVEFDERSCDAVARLAEELGISTLDLRPTFRSLIAADPDAHLYYQFDHHLNVYANKIVADRLELFFTKALADSSVE